MRKAYRFKGDEHLVEGLTGLLTWNLMLMLVSAGGVREAYRFKGEEYQLFWPEKSGALRALGLLRMLCFPAHRAIGCWAAVFSIYAPAAHCSIMMLTKVVVMASTATTVSTLCALCRVHPHGCPLRRHHHPLCGGRRG